MANRRIAFRIAPLAALLAILPAGCSGGDPDLTRVGIIGETPTLVETVNAPLTAGQAALRSNIAQGLVRFDARGQIVPGIAERWNVSDDGLNYIFRLQMGDWPDGRKIKADEVARLLSRQLRAANRNPLYDTLGAVSEVVPMTDRVIEIRLIAPRPNLLQLLAQPEFGLVRAGHGSGPFQPNEPLSAARDEARTIDLERHIAIPDADEIREKIALSGGPARALVDQFVAGKLDLVTGGTFNDLPIAVRQGVPRGTLRYDPAIGLFGLMPNRRNTPLDDRDLRRLLSRALDRSTIVADLGINGLLPRATILQSGLDGIGEPNQPDWLGQNVADRRAALIAEANRLFGKTERPTIRIDLPQGAGGDLLIRRIADSWAPLGVKVGRATNRASADLVLIDDVAPSSSPAWFLRHFRCAVTPVCLEEVEPVFVQARSTLIAADRAALFGALSIKMDEAQLFIPIAAPVRWSLVSRALDGFVENPMAHHTFVGLKDSRARELGP